MKLHRDTRCYSQLAALHVRSGANGSQEEDTHEALQISRRQQVEFEESAGQSRAREEADPRCEKASRARGEEGRCEEEARSTSAESRSAESRSAQAGQAHEDPEHPRDQGRAAVPDS